MTTRLTLAALGVLAAAGCASAPAVSPVEAEALLAEYFGTWALADIVEAPGPPAFPVPRREQVRVTTTAENRDRVMRQVERDIRDDNFPYDDVITLRSDLEEDLEIPCPPANPQETELWLIFLSEVALRARRSDLKSARTLLRKVQKQLSEANYPPPQSPPPNAS